MPAAPSVVILRPLGLGDFLTGVPAYRAIARAFPGHRIVLAAPPAFVPLLECVGAIDELVPTRPLEPLDSRLHAAAVAIDLHGRGPASHRILLAARPRRLIAFRNAEIPESAGGAQWREEEHEVERWCRMLVHAGITADPSDLDLLLGPNAIAREEALTIVHPSAASESRRWPVERWAAVARVERAAGHRVLVTGSANDVERAVEIAQRAGIERSHVVAGCTDLRELAGLVARAGRVICGDTGIAHVATAVRTPSVLLSGPMSPALWGPPPQRPYHRVLWTGRSGDPHGTSIDPGLLAISVDAVLEALDTLDERVPYATAALN
jgi:ADP-heptose:LPS heptosyltransferase